MKQKKVRLLGLLLAAVMLLGCLPVQALAAEGGWFYLAADWNGTLLIAPERVSLYGRSDAFRSAERQRPQLWAGREQRDADRWQNRKFYPQ